MTSRGATQSMAANALGIEEKCLRRHYRDELDGGAVTAAIFWLKTQAGWREVGRGVEVAADQPITIRWKTEACTSALHPAH